jgi:RimJ/RimL family protein N-acetyltransferase
MIYGYDEIVAHWVAEQLDVNGFGDCKAIGVGLGKDIIAGVVYHNYRPPLSIECSIAATNKKWASKRTLKELFSYPFIQLGVKRINVFTDIGNHPVREFLHRLGFTEEGIHPEAHPNGDAVSMGMLKRNCKWIEVPYGQEIITEAATGS